VAQWLGEQGWSWQNLPEYQARVCDVGVVGSMLGWVDEDVLLQDVNVRHLKPILSSISDELSRH
jgi:hypothetical protein